jgi:ribonuclease P protein subunit RPR2
MAKAKTQKAVASAPNKALHSRVSYLYQAAAFLSTRQLNFSETAGSDIVEPKRNSANTDDNGTKTSVSQNVLGPGSLSLSRKLLADLRSVSLKAQIRLSPTIKHSICKRCDTMLIEGSTCTSGIENQSKHGRKPWADVLVRTCSSCGSQRRFPVTAERQKRRPFRVSKVQDADISWCGSLSY